MALVIEIAEAVKDELNGTTFSEPFTAGRYYQPLFKLPEMQTLHVSVVPQSLSILPLGRSANIFDVKVDVAVQKKFQSNENTELDPLMSLVEEIAEHFRLNRLSLMPAAMWIKTENSPIFAQEHMEELRQFTSILTFTFRVQQ